MSKTTPDIARGLRAVSSASIFTNEFVWDVYEKAGNVKKTRSRILFLEAATKAALDAVEDGDSQVAVPGDADSATTVGATLQSDFINFLFVIDR